MKAMRSIALTLALILGIVVSSHAGLPWGTVQNVTGSTPAPTTVATAPVIIDLMTGNTTMASLTGITAGGYYTLILEQDGTGGRTFTAPANIVGLPAAIPTAANAWTACIMKGVGSNAVVQDCYDSISIATDYTNTQATAGTAIAPNARQQQTAISVPGVTTTTPCSCNPQTYPATWQVGIFTECEPTTNQVVCDVVNPTAATQTAAAVTLNIRFTK